MLLFALFSCGKNPTKRFQVLEDSPGISLINEVVYYQNQKFNGTLIAMHQRDTLKIENYKNGLLDGLCIKWYLNRNIQEIREYHLGRKNGRQVSFWENGHKRFEFWAKDDAYEGALKEWTVEGKLFHLAHYVNGQEEGIQKLWYENGKIRANYVIKNGKRYGLLGTKNCKNVSDSIFVVR